MQLPVPVPAPPASSTHTSDAPAQRGPAAALGQEHVKYSTWRDGCGAEFVRWCGLLLNTSSLEVQADYTRLCGTHVSTYINVPLSNRPGEEDRYENRNA
jgi:hypothetical protein